MKCKLCEENAHHNAIFMWVHSSCVLDKIRGMHLICEVWKRARGHSIFRRQIRHHTIPFFAMMLTLQVLKRDLRYHELTKWKRFGKYEVSVISSYMMRCAIHHQINVNVKRIDGGRDVQNEGMRKVKSGGTTYFLVYAKKWRLIRDDCWMTRNSRR